MIRRALLIGVGAASGEAPLPGTYQDINQLQSYLTSITGGAWDSTEIVALRDPTKSTVLSARRALAGADFCFVTFSGHGCERELKHPNGLRYPMTCLVCADGLEVTRAELTPADGRSIVLLDCCRVFQPITLTEKTSSVGATLDSRQQIITRQMARALFDQALASAQLGPEFVYGCQFNSTASDVPSFTGSLLASSNYWGARSSGALDLASAFEKARQVHEQVSPGRKPTLELGRGSVHRPVPFAIGNQLYPTGRPRVW